MEAFSPLKSPWVDLGRGLSGQAGVPHLSGNGALASGNLISLSLEDALASAPATFVVGISELNVPFKGGMLVPYPTILVGLATNLLGQIKLSANWPAGIPSGFSIYGQWWIADPAGANGFAASNAVSGTVF